MVEIEYQSLKDILFFYDKGLYKCSELPIYPTRFRSVKLGGYGVADMISTGIELRHEFIRGEEVKYEYLNIRVYSIIEGDISEGHLLNMAYTCRGVLASRMGNNEEKYPLPIQIEGIIVCKSVNFSEHGNDLLDLTDKLSVYVYDPNEYCVFRNYFTLPNFNIEYSNILPF